MGYTQKKHLPITSTPVHITYRLSGSIPKITLEKLETKKNLKLQRISEENTDKISRQEIKVLNEKRREILVKHELALEAALHQIKTGPFHLKNHKIRDIVLDSWKNLHDRGIIYLIAVCVMGNHVHVILKAPEGISSVSTASVMKSHKGFTARKANQVLGKTYANFWDSNYHDRSIRQGKFITVMWYVLNNPVKAGLVSTWTDWPGTFVNDEYIELFLKAVKTG